MKYSVKQPERYSVMPHQHLTTSLSTLFSQSANPVLAVTPTPDLPNVRLIRLDEINEEGHQAYRQALANVYATLDPQQPVRLLYVLDGSASGVSLYYGVASDQQSTDLHEAMKNLRGALEGQLPGINFGEQIKKDERNTLLERLQKTEHQGIMLGAPTQSAQDDAQNEQNFQGLDRLVRALQSGGNTHTQNDGRWQLIVVSQPLERTHIHELLNTAYGISSQLAGMISTSVQTSGNTSYQRSISEGTSDALGNNLSASIGKNQSYTSGTNQSYTEGTNQSHTSGTNQSHTGGTNQSHTSGTNQSHTGGTNQSYTSGTNQSHTKGTNQSHTNGTNQSHATGTNQSHATGTNQSKATGINQSKADTSSKNESGTETKSGGENRSSGDSYSSRGSNSGWSEAKTVGTGTSHTDTTGSSDTRTFGSSDTKTSGSSDTKTSGSSDSRTSGSSDSNTSGSSDSNTSGTSDSRTSGTSDSRTSGSSDSRTSGSSDTQTFGISNTHTTTNNISRSDTLGSSLGITQEITDKRAQHLAEYLDKQLINRLQKGLAKGLFHSALYFSAENKSTYQRLKNTLRATYQGNEATFSALEVYDLTNEQRGHGFRLPSVGNSYSPEEWLFRSLHKNPENRFGSLLTGDELAIVASLPQNELQGIRRRKAVNFIVDLPDVTQSNTLDLGIVIDQGRRYPNNRVHLSSADLNKHIFVTGVTGAGKTTTCLNLLLESGLPFLVIEPAKTEYRALANALGDAVRYYRPNGDDYQSLRLNPFALIRKGQRIKSHAGFLKNVFTAVFPMEASMPMMVEAAILAAYEDKGWDIDENEFLPDPDGDPFAPLSRAWPTLSDMICQLDRLLPTYQLGRELEEKYRGSLVSRLRSLTDGTLGRVLDVPQSLDFSALLQAKSVIELEELQGGEEKALLMALLLGAINETMRDQHAKNPNFRQLTLIEEAHRLLSRPEAGDKAAALAVESFADMLAEVRKYGTGLIIADQIPAKLIPDVIKNTHCKIVHRLFAEDDRRAMGETMMMSDEQRAFLPNLKTGEAIVFCGGWHGPTHAAIRNDHAQTDTQHAFALEERSVQQLWQERARYYPHFCRLGWLSVEDRDATHFAAFVRATRQAQNQLLQLLTTDKDARRQTAFKALKKWLTDWQPRAEQHTVRTQTPLSATATWPEPLLAATWLALLLDANPLPRVNVKTVKPLYLAEEYQFHAATSATLLDAITNSATPEELEEKINEKIDKNRDLKKHLEHLVLQFKRF